MWIWYIIIIIGNCMLSIGSNKLTETCMNAELKTGSPKILKVLTFIMILSDSIIVTYAVGSIPLAILFTAEFPYTASIISGLGWSSMLGYWLFKYLAKKG